jgi:hypothetical protein
MRLTFLFFFAPSPMPDTTRTLFSEMSHYSSSDEAESEPSDLFESDIYPLRGDDFAKLKEQLTKTRGFDKEL